MLSLVGGIRVARLMIAATVLWYATLLLFVQMQTVPTAIACLVLAGFSQSLAMISIAVILMRTAAENFRGRVMGVRMMVIYGLPLGPVGRRQPDRRHRLRRDGNAVCDRRHGADARRRAALARGSVAGACAGQCKVGYSVFKRSGHRFA